MWGNLEETSLLPYPTGNVRRFREDDCFTGLSSEVSEVQFFQDADIVFCTLILIVTTDDDIILKSDTSSFLDVFPKNFGKELV